MAKIPLNPKHPERTCWGCDKYCPAEALACGNGTIRTPHPAELFGADWLEWSLDENREAQPMPAGSAGDEKGPAPIALRISAVNRSRRE